MRIIAGTHKGRPLLSPEDKNIRPTSDKIRQALFNILEHGIGFSFENKIVLDIFGGTGALGFEALSRGAQKVFYCDLSKDAHKIASQNALKLHLKEQIEFFQCNVSNPPKAKIQADLVFLDPPYDQKLGEKALIAFHQNGWFHKETIFVLEESKNAILSVPEFLEIMDKRPYGKTILYFFKSRD